VAVADGDAKLLEVEVRVLLEVEVEVAAAVNEAREVTVAVVVMVSLTCSLRFLRIAAASSVVKMERRTSRKRKGMRNDNAKSTAAVWPRSATVFAPQPERPCL
jgi:hypothetical protein